MSDRRIEPRPDRIGLDPGDRALWVIGGGCLVGIAAEVRGRARWAFALGGLAVMARGAIGAPIGRLVRSGGDPYAFEAYRSIRIDKPVADVFALLSDYENYPDFMPNVADMQTLPGDRHRWTMLGPAGVPIPVRDRIIDRVENEFVAWESEAGSAFPYAGAARFTPDGPGTRVDARMSYGPPLGAVGDLGARLIGQDPGAQLGSILGRAKSYLESGHMPADSIRAA